MIADHALAVKVNLALYEQGACQAAYRPAAQLQA